MADIRYRVAVAPAVSAGGSELTTLATPDDNRKRRITGLAHDMQSADATISILRTGYDAIDMSTNIGVNEARYRPCDLEFPVGIQIQILWTAGSGGSFSGGEQLEIRYELE